MRDERRARSRRRARRRRPRARGSRGRGRSSGCGGPTPRSPPWPRAIEPPPLQAQQRRDGLQVVLHPVVDLADRGVLGQQQPVPAAQLGDVAEQHHRAGRPRPGRRSGRQRTTTVISLPRSTSTTVGWRRWERGPHRALVEAELAEAQALGVGVHPDPVERRHGVGRRVLDPAGRVEQRARRRPPAAPRRCPPCPREGEVARGDHPGEAVEDVEVGPLELAVLAPDGRGRLPGQHADDLAVAAHRDAEHPHPLPHDRQVDLALDDLAVAVRTGRRGGARPRGAASRPSRPGRRSGRWWAAPGPAPRTRRPPKSPTGANEEQVGEAEVGQQPPGRRRAAASASGLRPRRAG